MITKEPKEGELYDLKDGNGWCRHGLVIIREVGPEGQKRLIAVDTYWGGHAGGSGLSRDWYELNEVSGRLTFLLDLNTARKTYEEEWEVYADEDRARIPMGGSSERLFVRNDAKPNYTRQVARFERLIRQERSRAEMAARATDRYEKDLQALKDSVVHRPVEMGPCRPDCGICAAALAK